MSSVSARFRFRTENGRLAKNPKKKKFKNLKKFLLLKKHYTNSTQKKWDEKKIIYTLKNTKQMKIRHKSDTNKIQIRSRSNTDKNKTIQTDQSF